MSVLTAEIRGFILTREWRDTDTGTRLVLWINSPRGPVRAVVDNQTPLFFILRSEHTQASLLNQNDAIRQCVDMKTMQDAPVDSVYCKRQRNFQTLTEQLKKQGIRLFETDIPPTERYLMERFIRGSVLVRGMINEGSGFITLNRASLKADDYEPILKITSIDIETARDGQSIFSVAVSADSGERVFMLGEKPKEVVRQRDFDIEYFDTERTLLQAFFNWISVNDPDVIIGWNVINFDLKILLQRSRAQNIPFALGRNNENATILEPRGASEQRLPRIPGRVVLDGIDTLRAAFWSFESFSLDAVAQKLLGKGKLIDAQQNKMQQIEYLFEHDKPALAQYNLQDCRLVRDIFDHTGLIDFAIQRSRITGLAFGRHGGSVAAFDHLYLPRLHRQGFVAPDIGAYQFDEESPGGYVMDSDPGLYQNVVLLDFKSLYPSIIKTFNIDPLGLAQPGDDPVPGFLDASFGRDNPILPVVVEELWQRRERAKRDNNKPLSQAVKIIMNSFYGVLGTSACRFYDPRLASSITRRGHEIIQQSKRWIEDSGYRVIYGDTDSLFIHLDGTDKQSADKLGNELMMMLNERWRNQLQQTYRLDSQLEVEYETLFTRFFMPTIRGSAAGSKKRYAGVVGKADGGSEILLKGLEAVRSDWTQLAREFQRELIRRIFADEPFEVFIRSVVQELVSGKQDNKLVYRKRLRQALSEYKKSSPPHVKAARLLDSPGRWVQYIITVNGPQPVEKLVSRPDYNHYIEKQLKPVADAVIQFKGKQFDEITSAQISLFG